MVDGGIVEGMMEEICEAPKTKFVVVHICDKKRHNINFCPNSNDM